MPTEAPPGNFRKIRSLRDEEEEAKALAAARNAALRRKAIKSLCKALLCIAVALLLFRSAWWICGDVRMSNVSDALKLLFTAGGSFPVSVSGSMQGQAVTKSTAGVVNEKTLYIYNAAGAEILAAPMEFANPVIIAYNGRYLVYDKDDGAFTLYSRTKTLYSEGVHSRVFGAALAQNGSVAIAHEGDKAAGAVTVFDPRGEKIFSQSYAYAYPGVPAFAGNGKEIALGVAFTKNAIPMTTLLRYSLKTGEVLEETEIKDFLPLHTVALSGQGILSFGADKAVFAAPGKQTTQTPYGEAKAVAFSADARTGLSGVLLDPYSSSEGEVWLFSRKGEKTREAVLPSAALAIQISGRTVVCNNTKDIYRFMSSTAVKVGEPLPAGLRCILSDGRTVFSFGTAGLDRIDTIWKSV
ncbi:MAG: DUF5711 family protein [Oscillospiraceae bacterium]|jgi:hypothetical protein|nr:DUF5711 family protein [Oscillospiraceae bacterium]